MTVIFVIVKNLMRVIFKPQPSGIKEFRFNTPNGVAHESKESF